MLQFHTHRRLSASIVLYKTPINQLHRCLESLKNCQSLGPIYVLDNSPSNALKYTIPIGLDIQYYHFPENPGYGAAHNFALNMSINDEQSYHLVINPDVFFEGDVMAPMLSYMEANLGVGQMMPLILNSDQSIQRLCKLVPTPCDLLFRRFTFGRSREKLNRRFELHDSGYDKLMFVPYLSGCFMLLRVSTLKEVGVFDERFFRYPEDIDLTRRIASKYETIFFPFVNVIHEYGAASKKSIRMFFVHSLNIIKYFNKWGWLFDSDRASLNLKTLSQFNFRK